MRGEGTQGKRKSWRRRKAREMWEREREGERMKLREVRMSGGEGETHRYSDGDVSLVTHLQALTRAGCIGSKINI
jgi:hypothetical protein